MEIELDNPDSLSVVVLDRLFASQVNVSVDKATGKYSVKAHGIPSGKDGNGDVVFTNDATKHMTVNDTDFLTTAIGYAIANGECTDVADFIAKSDAETVLINAETMTVAKALAYYIVGIGEIFKISGADVKGLK